MSAPAPKKSISVLGYDVPYYEHMLAGELIELEDLVWRDYFRGTRGDLETLAVLVRHRLNLTVSVEEWLKQPIDMEELGAAVEVLTGPFAHGTRAKRRRQERLLASQLETPALKAEIERLEEEIAERKRMLQELENGA